MTQSRIIILQRREKVKDLYFVRRYSLQQVAKVLEWNYETIWKDVQAIKQEINNEIEKKDINKYFTGITLRNSNIINKAWKEYENASSVQVKLNALKIIQEADKFYLDILERFGIILPPIQRTVNVNIDINERMKRWFNGNPISNSEIQ